MMTRLIDVLNSIGDRFSVVAFAASIQIALLVAALYLIDRCIRHRARAVVRYAIWLLVLVKLVLPVSLRTPLSAGYWIAAEPEGWHALSEVRAKGVVDGSGPLPSEVVRRGAPGDARHALPASGRATRPPEMQAPSIIENEATAFMEAPIDAAPVTPRGTTEPAAVPVAPVAQPPWPALRPAGWIFAGWSLIVAALVGLFVRRSLNVRRLVVNGVEPPDAVRLQLAECCAALAVRTPVALKLVERLHSPAICGLVRPTILLPASLAETLGREPLRLVFIHELTHWKRGDLQVQFVQGVLQILYFFHPAVWFANAMLRRLREQAVDESVLVVAPNQRGYGETLIDISAGPLVAPELSLGLLGVVESRRALTERIRRIVERPLPKSARLGAVGLLAVVLLGLTLVPMAGRTRAAQPPRTEAPAKAQAEKKPAGEAQPSEPAPKESDAAMSGRIVDEKGEPVADAKVQLSPTQGGKTIEARVDEQGRYRLDRLISPGEYRLSVLSERCVSLRRFDQLPLINVAAGVAIVRDVTLPRGCRIRVRAIDEQEKPIAGVGLYVTSVGDSRGVTSEHVATDKEGWATIPALPASTTEYLVAAMQSEFGLARLTVRLNDPEAVPEHTITLAAGKDVKGTAVCSDGHPPAGWHIYAIPTWWNFGVYPAGAPIAEDGSFTLPHIVPGAYKVSIHIPISARMSTTQTLLSSENLSERAAPLALKVDYPSPASMSPLEIKVEYAAGRTKRGIHVMADSIDNRYHGSEFLQPNDDKVVLGPLPRGEYRVSFQSNEIEPLELKSVEVPAKDLAVKVTVTGQPSLRGRVVAAASNEPVPAFRIRVEKKKTLRGPTFQESPTPREFKDAQGRFDAAVAGPGVYVLHVSADGFAPASTEELNTDTDKGREIVLKLNKPGAAGTSGPSLSGMVVNGKQEPIDGATVRSLARRYARTLGGESGDPAGETVKTTRGSFRLGDLKPGRDVIEVQHPDYAPRYFETDIAAEGPPVTIALNAGATIRGHVYDVHGRPESGVGIGARHDYSPHGPSGELDPSAVAVTDRNGFYELAHLPEGNCTVKRVKEWESDGVILQTLRLEGEQTVTLDFGGKSEVKGQLIVNGAPLGGIQLVISDDGAFGTLRAFTRTEADGSFVFRGVPAGRRALDYYVSNQRNQLVHVGRFTIRSDGNDLGRLEVRTGSISVHFVKPMGLETGDVRLSFVPYDPQRLNLYGNVQRVVTPDASDKPFVIGNVPVGRYEVTAVYGGGRARIQEVEIAEGKLDQTVSITFPQGSSTFRVRMDPAKLDPTAPRHFVVQSRDNRFQAALKAVPGDMQEVTDLPPGDYFVSRGSTRAPAGLGKVTVSAGETQEVDITEAVLRDEETNRLFLAVYTVTSGGLPLPGCEVTLVQNGNTLLPTGAPRDFAMFVGVVGKYELKATYPGFEPLTQAVSIQPRVKDKKPVGTTIRVELKPLSPP